MLRLAQTTTIFELGGMSNIYVCTVMWFCSRVFVHPKREKCDLEYLQPFSGVIAQVPRDLLKQAKRRFGWGNGSDPARYYPRKGLKILQKWVSVYTCISAYPLKVPYRSYRGRLTFKTCMNRDEACPYRKSYCWKSTQNLFFDAFWYGK